MIDCCSLTVTVCCYLVSSSLACCRCAPLLVVALPCRSCVMSEAISLPPFFCDGCKRQFKPQGFANHQKKCKKRMEKRERDHEYESNLQALEEEARQSRLRSPKRCKLLQFMVYSTLIYVNSPQAPASRNKYLRRSRGFRYVLILERVGLAR